MMAVLWACICLACNDTIIGCNGTLYDCFANLQAQQFSFFGFRHRRWKIPNHPAVYSIACCALKWTVRHWKDLKSQDLTCFLSGDWHRKTEGSVGKKTRRNSNFFAFVLNISFVSKIFQWESHCVASHRLTHHPCCRGFSFTLQYLVFRSGRLGITVVHYLQSTNTASSTLWNRAWTVGRQNYKWCGEKNIIHNPVLDHLLSLIVSKRTLRSFYYKLSWSRIIPRMQVWLSLYNIFCMATRILFISC